MNNEGIVLVNPPLSLEERYGRLAIAGGIEPPFGLCYLASMVRKQGYKVYIVDAQALRIDWKETIKIILSYRPKFVGFTACTSQIKSASNIAKVLKMISPKIISILGGPHLSAIPKVTMEAYPEFDIGVVGEGEQTLCDILSVDKRGGDLSAVDGLIVRKDGEMFLTRPRSFIRNLDSLPPPAFDLLPQLSRFYRVPMQSINCYPTISLVTSRGCPGQCIFCDRSVFGNYTRGHSAQYIMNLVKALSKEYGIKSIMFEDDNFLLFRQRLFKFIDMLKKERLNLHWSCLARVDMVDEQLLRLMKNAGCWQILYGIESCSQQILDFLKKGITLEQIEHAIEMTQRAGINTKGFFMFGNPLETKETIQITIDFIKRSYLDDISITFFTPYPGSEVYATVENYGKLERDWSKMTCFDTVFIPYGFSKIGLEKALKKTYWKFYFRPRIIISYFKRIKSFNSFLKYLSSVSSLILYILKNKSNKTKREFRQMKEVIVNGDKFGLIKGVNSRNNQAQ